MFIVPYLLAQPAMKLKKIWAGLNQTQKTAVKMLAIPVALGTAVVAAAVQLSEKPDTPVKSQYVQEIAEPKFIFPKPD